jgi:cell division transport system permease protein
MFNSILKLYEKNIVDNYSLVVVSSSKIESLNNPLIASIKQIDISKQIEKMKKEYKNIDFSKITLPYFYRLKLKKFPSPNELNELTQYLKNKAFIKRVLTHSSSQSKIYNLLMLLKIITKTFMIITGVLGFLLIIKQLEVWKLSHSERMYIMELFGAPFWLKGAALFKIAIIDSFFAILITLGIIYLIANSAIFIQTIKNLNILYSIDYLKIAGILFIVSFSISLISSVLVVISKKEI